MNSIDVNSTLWQMENNTAQANYEQNRNNLGSSKISKDGFLQMLLAQLKYQDPTNPVKDTEFISQQAQFTQIEQMEELTSTLAQGNQLSQAGSMVGKYVEVLTFDNTSGQPQYVSGRVSSVSIDGRGIQLKVGSKFYSLNQITQVFAENPGASGGEDADAT